MATIYKRINKDGSVSYRMMIRRKECPLFTLTFSTLKEAEEWVALNEAPYIRNPDLYLKWAADNRLNLNREREFKRKA